MKMMMTVNHSVISAFMIFMSFMVNHFRAEVTNGDQSLPLLPTEVDFFVGLDDDEA